MSENKQHEEATQQLHAVEKQLENVRASLKQRFDEIARMTEELEKERDEEAALVNQLQVMRQKQGAEVSAESESEEKARLAEALQRKHIELVANSDLFDAEWYLETYPDVKKSETFAQQPATHYTLFGGFEGRNPCPAFDSRFYLQQYEDVRNVGLNPLVHYLKFGRDEGRLMSAQVDDE